MIPGIIGMGGRDIRPNLTLKEIIDGLGLATNLKLCLDAGDALSFTSGQKWLDTSGNGYDFFRGTTSSSQSTDPTFNGVAGNKSKNEYWSFDGGDCFKYDTTNETWMERLHKDNAIFSMAAWVYCGVISAQHYIFATMANAATDTGISFHVGGIDKNPVIEVEHNGADVATITALDEGLIVVENSWNFISLSLTEATGVGGVWWNVNGVGAVDTEASTYSSPDAGDDSQPAFIGSFGTNFFSPSGYRIAQLAVWEGGAALSAANLDALFNLTRDRFL
jgi:hypothetical protein